ncbi:MULTISPECIES: DUF2860 family protein [Chromobacterium]|uniref:DUF2860 family protein n=1 Tax=Chromobacterium aquaticum TaxID=467180 RepID=A0ABV8ZX76_9NEIS|nr:DUF2860 family protein [Chromobacterium aquaticum]MCD5361146.1 DUF2860 domain-containing protein [Chromobacterium aquaticum]
MRNISIGLSALLLAGLAAADPIPTESGFNGSVGLGVGGNKVKSNLYKGDKNQRTNSLNDSPESHNDTFALPVLSLSYTFAASRTQIVFDSQIHDPLGMDDTLELGVRQEVGNNGIVSAGLLYGGLSKNTWTDPYAVGVDRDSTKRKSTGLLLGWENIMGTGFKALLTQRNIKIDDERSGQSVASLSAADRATLNRNGDATLLKVGYEWAFAPNQTLTPGLVWGKDKLDGGAMSNKSAGLSLDYAYSSDLNTFTAGLLYRQQRFDQANPLFNNKKADSKAFAIDVGYLRHQLFGYKALSGFVSAAYGKSNSDISFYDAGISSFGTGLVYSF